MQFPLMLLLDLGKNIKDEPILAAIEGSRDFRPPSGLGMMKYQGGVIAVFAGNITGDASSYLRDSKSNIVRTEQIEGHAVAVFEGNLSRPQGARERAKSAGRRALAAIAGK
jgi:hypothetical protein